MEKVSLPPDTLLLPLPVALVTAAGPPRPNIITLAWVGVVCSVPPMVGIAIRPSRHTHALVAVSGEFVVNIPPASLLEKTDFCGTVSGRGHDKFREAGLTPLPAETVKAPLIAECPLALECAVRHTLKLGSHDLFIGEVLKVRADKELAPGGKLDLSGLDPLAYWPGTHEYRRCGGAVGRYGFTRGRLKG